MDPLRKAQLRRQSIGFIELDEICLKSTYRSIRTARIDGRIIMQLRTTLKPVLHVAVALLCFAPLAVVALLGLLAIPMWSMTLKLDESGSAALTDTERWRVLGSIALVCGALVGLVGLVWVVFLCVTGWKPRGLRNITRVLVAVGLVTLITFNMMFPIVWHPVRAFWPLMVYLVLPGSGAIYFLRQQRDYIGFSKTDSRYPE